MYRDFDSETGIGAGSRGIKAEVAVRVVPVSNTVVSDTSTATVVTPRRAVAAIACRVPNSSPETVPDSGQLNRGVPGSRQSGPPKDGVMDEKKGTVLVPVNESRAELPPILAGRHTAAVERRCEASTSPSPTSSNAGSLGAEHGVTGGTLR